MLSTKPLLVKLNPALLLRAIHHPDPLTRQQTQRFLDAVTTSFRKNLDKEHYGPLSEDRTTHATPVINAETNAATTTAGGGANDARRRPTDHHLASILSNPLFHASSTNTPKPVPKRDPMDVFDDAVSRGLMTAPIATGCLKAKQSLVRNSRSPFLSNQQSAGSDRFSGFNVGDRVLDWLRSSGMERTLEFAHHHNFVAALMPFLVAEGKEEVAWNWLTRLMSSRGANVEGSFAAARHILLYLVRSKAVGVECVDSAFESIIQASEEYRNDPRHGQLLVRAWRDVAWRTTTLAWQKPSPSPSLFDAYLGVANFLYPSHTNLPVAHLHLHHPATPTHDRALDYFNHARKGEKAGPPERMQREAMMGVDTVSHLGLLGELEEAKSLMDYIHSKYSFFFQKSHASKGDELLDTLEPA